MAYIATIHEASFELSARDRIRFKDMSNSASLDELTNEAEFIIHNPKGYVIVDITNDAVDPPEYTKIVVIDDNGASFSTGSDSFIRSFVDIFKEMEGEGEYDIVVSKHESKNYKGKGFIKASIL